MLSNKISVVLKTFAKHVKARMLSADPFCHSTPETMRNMADSIDSECVSALLYPVQIAVDQVILHCRVMLIEIG